jgi:hypothetical protein
MVQINPKLIHVPKHQRDRMMGAPLADALRDQYKKKKTLRVVKGDSVRVFRGQHRAGDAAHRGSPEEQDPRRSGKGSDTRFKRHDNQP